MLKRKCFLKNPNRTEYVSVYQPVTRHPQRPESLSANPNAIVQPAWPHIPDAPSRTPTGTCTVRPPACSARAAAGDLQDPQSIPTLRREPAQMTTQGGRQLMAAQCRKPCHRLLKVHHPTAGQSRATQGGRLQVLDSEIHHVGTRDHLTQRRLP